MRFTTPTNRTLLFEFAATVCQSSENLKSLHLEGTGCTPQDADDLMQALAESEFTTLESLTIRHEPKWFANGREECLAPLISVIARQTNLSKLDLAKSNL